MNVLSNSSASRQIQEAVIDNEVIGSSYLSSPDQPSSVYPDRLIRPLPRRSIRSRLSQETAESINYPPKLPSTNLPAYTHYGENGEFLSDPKHLAQQNGSYELEHEHDHDHEEDDEHCQHHHHHHCHHDHDEDEFDSAEESSPVALRHSSSYRSSPRSPRLRHSRYGSYGMKGSNAPDGYEAFENTNNKKKRKIPTSGSLGFHHPGLANDLSSTINGQSKDGDELHYYGSSSPSGIGMQGPGRGRHGRKSGSRNPLGVSVNGSNPRVAPSKYDQISAPNAKGEEPKSDQGIISAAIANATALLRNPLGKGRDNIGVIDQQNKTAPANSQFTFTCESEAKGVKFPEQSLYSPDYSQRVGSAPSVMPHHRGSTHATQTSPKVSPQNHQSSSAQQHPPGIGPPPRKPRRRRGDVYALAARQRKLQQEYLNLQHPPAPEDIWICEFCEYESIFGEPPRALIRQYEIKDRRERKRLAEKQRLLEKAKMKGRKGKKQSKNAAKAAGHTTQQSSHQPAYDQQSLDPVGDDYLDDGYDDDPSPVSAPATQTIAGHSTQDTQTNGSKAGGGINDGGGVR